MLVLGGVSGACVCVLRDCVHACVSMNKRCGAYIHMSRCLTHQTM